MSYCRDGSWEDNIRNINTAWRLENIAEWLSGTTKLNKKENQDGQLELFSSSADDEFYQEHLAPIQKVATAYQKNTTSDLLVQALVDGFGWGVMKGLGKIAGDPVAYNEAAAKKQLQYVDILAKISAKGFNPSENPDLALEGIKIVRDLGAILVAENYRPRREHSFS